MNTNENIRNETPEDIIVLGIASVETQGGPLMNEVIGGFTASGISQD
jgi:hypothetical protein